MNSSNKRIIIAVLVVAALIALVAITQPKQEIEPFNKYEGLVTIREIEMDDETRKLLLGRIAETQAQIDAHLNGEGLDEEGNAEELDLDLYLSLASDYYLMGDLVNAREALEKQLDGNPMHFGAWNSYGEVLRLMEDYDNAKFAFKKAIDVSNGGTEEVIRDYILLLEKYYPGSDDEVFEMLEFGVKTRGQTPWLMVKLAEWYFEHDDCQRSEAHYKVAIALSPANESIQQDYQTVKRLCAE